ncbi:hypothetical Protein YC6258_03571 [Gynuella sunshinyii YC6258]|uniref:Uncharacterized protein n=1 Tax=Gynuella sunshinyii YC6258 TaxID=1445510 RepID=A0A0C5VLL2_9GAMM|nr:hypothetical Protein YC6258_03571 [Gynuella sunshinyii YC6258]
MYQAECSNTALNLLHRGGAVHSLATTKGVKSQWMKKNQ